MPLPKPPAKRAALLSQADFESQAAPQPGKRPQKTRVAAEPAAPAVLDLFDGAALPTLIHRQHRSLANAPPPKPAPRANPRRPPCSI